MGADDDLVLSALLHHLDHGGHLGNALGHLGGGGSLQHQAVNSGQGELTCYIDFADGSGAWEYIEMSFTPKFNPFTQE